MKGKKIKKLKKKTTKGSYQCVHCGGSGIMSDSEFAGETCFMCGGTGVLR